MSIKRGRSSKTHDYDHHSSHGCWVPIFVAWAEGDQSVLDFDGVEVPRRLQMLLEAGLRQDD